MYLSPWIISEHHHHSIGTPIYCFILQSFIPWGFLHIYHMFWSYHSHCGLHLLEIFPHKTLVLSNFMSFYCSFDLIRFGIPVCLISVVHVCMSMGTSNKVHPQKMTLSLRQSWPAIRFSTKDMASWALPPFINFYCLGLVQIIWRQPWLHSSWVHQPCHVQKRAFSNTSSHFYSFPIFCSFCMLLHESCCWKKAQDGN